MPLNPSGQESGWIHKYAFQVSALAADATGRSAMQDGFIQNSKIADGQITASKLANGKVLQAGTYGYAKYGSNYYG